MGAIFVFQGILIYIYGFDHNPPHIHVRKGDESFTITIVGREVQGTASAKTISLVNDFLDEYQTEVLEIWEKAQRGEKITKINR